MALDAEGIAARAVAERSAAVGDVPGRYKLGSVVVIAPFLDETDHRIGMESLFGDPIARSLGFTPRGRSDRAGLALAVRDAAASGRVG